MTKKKSIVKEDRPITRSSKDNRLFQNLLKTVQQFMQGKGYSPLSEKELFERLSMPPQHDSLFHEVLIALQEDKSIELSKGKYRWKKQNVLTGILRVHPRGFGFLQTDDPTYEEDVFVPKHQINNAVDGDTVEVEVMSIVSEKGPEGRVTTILSRGRTHVAGIVRSAERDGDIVLYVPLLGPQQRVVVYPSKERTLRVGDRIIMKVSEWGEKMSDTVGNMTSYLGHISDPSSDIKAAIAEYELRSTFPQRAIHEAETYGTQVPRNEIAKREDLRNIECFTIDPKTAKDFDDAIHLFTDDRGHYHLGVHIADVSFYVHPETALDEEAFLRCNSTYFPGTCLPMLPSELSENLCSLQPNVNRLTVSVLVEFDPEGNQVNYRISRTVIKSAKRFTYEEAKEVLDGKRKSRHADTLNLMVKLCKLLKKKRYERGSIEFSIPELVIQVDKEGVPYGTDLVSYDITHQLVEEFMLKANEIVATHLTEMGKGVTYRVHDEPSEENMRDFAMLANAFGFSLSDKPTSLEIQNLFDDALHTPYGPYLASSYIRRMRLAVYSPDNIGHFGLSLTHYCHFTSPIRRYVDLVAHRILFGETTDRVELQTISDRASERERLSAKAESSVLTLKKLRLLQSAHEKEPKKQYPAVISRVKNFGILFEIIDFMLEGFLHVSELADDYYVFEEEKMILRGRHRGKVYHAGDKITVMLKDIDLIMQEAKWNYVPEKDTLRVDPRRDQDLLLAEEGFEEPKKKLSRRPGQKTDRQSRKKGQDRFERGTRAPRERASERKSARGAPKERGRGFSEDVQRGEEGFPQRQENIKRRLEGVVERPLPPPRMPFPAVRPVPPPGRTYAKPAEKSSEVKRTKKPAKGKSKRSQARKQRKQRRGKR